MNEILLCPLQEPHFDDLILPRFIRIDDTDWAALHDVFGGFDKEGYELCQYEKWMYAACGIELMNCLGHDLAQYPWFIQNQDVKTNIHVDHSLRLYRFGFDEEAKEYLRTKFEYYRPVANLINLKPKFGLDLEIDYIEDSGDVTEVFHLERDYRTETEYIDAKLHWQEVFLVIDWEHVGSKIVAHKDEYAHLGGPDQANWKANYVLGNNTKAEINLRTII